MKMKYSIAIALAVASLHQAAAANFVTNTGSLTANGTINPDYYIAFNLQASVAATKLGVYVGTGSLSETLTVRLWSGGTGQVFNSNTAALLTLSVGAGDGAADAAGYVYAAIPGGYTLQGDADQNLREAYALTVSGRTTNKTGNDSVGDSTPVYGLGVGQFADEHRLVVSSSGNPYEGGFGTGFEVLTGGAPHLNIASFSTTPVPEPETYAMLAGLGLVGFGLYRRCRN